jgi:hypothetical protein
MSTREFADFLEVADKVFGQYRADQPKWKRMDGTPILNDIAADLRILRGCCSIPDVSGFACDFRLVVTARFP